MGYLIVPDLKSEKVICQNLCSHTDCKATKEEWEKAICVTCSKSLKAGDLFYYLENNQHQCANCAWDENTK